jgi:hypothetical protein
VQVAVKGGLSWDAWEGREGGVERRGYVMVAPLKYTRSFLVVHGKSSSYVDKYMYFKVN